MTRTAARWLLLLAAACVGPGHEPEAPGAVDAPSNSTYALVLGTAQDGGLPQIGCEKPCCEAARVDPARRRLVASLLVVDATRQLRWLIDATPDLPEQWQLAREHPPQRRAPAPMGDSVPLPEGRPAPFDGILLTHAHVGHYVGLAQLGKEVFAAQQQRVYAGSRMNRFLHATEPWGTLEREGRVYFWPWSIGETQLLTHQVTVEPLAVPHRDELSETLAFIIRGPNRSLLYLPDIDAWERWDRRLADVLAEVDVALIDGTFFDVDELPGRDPSAFPHPTIRHTLKLLAPLPASERAKVLFTHLNHSNPAADPDSAAAAAVRAAGCGVAREGQVIPL